MTAETTEQAPPPIAEGALLIQTPTHDDEHKRVPFQLDDDPTVLIGTRPKMAVLIDVVDRFGDVDTMEALHAVATLKELVPVVMDQASVDHLNARFLDPADTLDLDVLEPIIESLLGLWFARPTGRPGSSAGSPSATGPRSTAKRRGKGSTSRR